jgi:predicted DNA-binding protein
MGRPRTTDQQFVIRAPTAMIETLKQFAARRNRSAAEVARNAIDIHLFESMLDLIENDRTFARALRQRGVDVAELRRDTRQSLARLRASAFGHPVPYSRFEPATLAEIFRQPMGGGGSA